MEYRDLSDDPEMVLELSLIYRTLRGYTIPVNDSGRLMSSGELKDLKKDLTSLLCRVNANLKLYHYHGDFSIGWNNTLEFTKRQNIKKITDQETIVSPKPGFVYLMFNSSTGMHKIGYSKNPVYRERILQSEKPTIETIHFFQGRFKDETALHIKYAEYRVRGEWFQFNENVLPDVLRDFKTVQSEQDDLVF